MSNSPEQFKSQVARHIQTVRGRLRAVHAQSTQELLNEANRPVAKGGRMRVDTGFLRNSLQVSLSGMPSGPDRNPTPRQQVGNQFEPISFSFVLGSADVNDTIYAGWTANYARWREYEDGFARSAAEKWPAIVAGVVAKLEASLR